MKLAEVDGGVDTARHVAVRRQVETILESADFVVSDRLKAFLRYIVEETLAGRDDRIKAYSVAVEVFGRDDTFDPQGDPVVRVEAARLRRSLERYYLTSGRDDAVLIEIPKGRYVPAFTFRAEPPPDAVPSPPPVDPGDEPGREAPAVPAAKRPPHRRPVLLFAAALVAAAGVGLFNAGALAPERTAEPSLQPSIVIAPLTAVGGEAALDFATSMTEEIDHQIARFHEVLPIDPSVAARDGRDLGSDYRIEGSVRRGERKLRVTVRLVEIPTAAVLWTQSFDADEGAGADGLIAAQIRMASEIASAVAQPYGAIFQAEAKSIGSLAAAPAETLSGRRCLVAFYMYRISLSAADHLKVRDCIGRVVDAYPRSSTARAMLSILATDEDRFAYNRVGGPSALDRALADAREAVRLDPQNMRALQALMLALWFSGEPDRALATGADAFALNPNDAEFLSEYGTRFAQRGDWGKGDALIETAMRMNPGGTPYYAGVLAFSAYMTGDIPRALFLVRQASVEQSPIFQLIAALIYADSGLEEDAARARALAMTTAPALFENLRSEAAKRNFRPADLERLLAGAERAGFPVALDAVGGSAMGSGADLAPPRNVQ